MMVSPLSVSTTVKDRSYNHEAVQRLFIGEHESILSGKVLKTPKQKIELQECLTAVKRIMKTPRQKAEPLEDIRGKILKTPKQKIEQQECLTGVKRIMKTPRQKAEPLEDIRGNLLKTPKQKIEPQECLTGVKKMFSTPQQADDPHNKHLESHEAASSDYVDLPGRLHSKTPPSSKSSSVCLSGVKRLLKTPRVKVAPVEDMVGVKRLLKTPREKGEPVADNFGIKRLMKSPKLKANAPVEDFEGLKELMKEPLPDPTEQEKNEVRPPAVVVTKISRVDEYLSLLAFLGFSDIDNLIISILNSYRLKMSHQLVQKVGVLLNFQLELLQKSVAFLDVN